MKKIKYVRNRFGQYQKEGSKICYLDIRGLMSDEFRVTGIREWTVTVDEFGIKTIEQSRIMGNLQMPEVLELLIAPDKYTSFKMSLVEGSKVLDVCDFGEFFIVFVEVATEEVKNKVFEIGFQHSRSSQIKRGDKYEKERIT